MPERDVRPTAKGTIISAAIIGNALEFYDFLSFAFFAVQIGRAFFPSTSPQASLLSSLAVFGVGFFTRPLGGFVLGMLGDRKGRKPAMLLSFSMMGFAILGVALTPSYRTIGLAAPVLVVLFRLIQGFALGGEFGPTTAYLIEIAPPERRGLYTSLQYASQDFAVLCAGLIGVVTSSLLDSASLESWGWRIPFLIGAAILPIGLLLRARLPETLEHHAAKDDQPTPPMPLRLALIGIVLLSCGTVCGYVLFYMATYATATLHMPTNVAFGSLVVGTLCGVILEPVSGWLSDRFGRRPIAFLSWTLLLVAVFPIFILVTHFRTPATLFLCTAMLGSFLVLGNAPILTSLGESFPKHLRSGLLAIIYAGAVSVFGGTTQFVVAWLISVTGNPLVPAWYMAVAVLIGLACMALLSETAPSRTKST